MANSVREFVIESLKSFYERLPLKKVAVDGSVLTPDASGIVDLGAIGNSPWEPGDGDNSAQLKGTSGAIGDGAVTHAYGSDEETIETPSWYIGQGYESEDYNYYDIYDYYGDGIDHEPWDTIIYNNNRYAVTNKWYSQFSTNPPLGINGETQAYVSIVLPPAGFGETSGLYSHTEGEITNAKGDYSHAEGTGKISYTSPPAAIYNVEENEWMFGDIDPEVYNCCLVFNGNYHSDNTPVLTKAFENNAMSLYAQYDDGYNVSLKLYNSRSFTPDNFICDIFANGNVEEYTYDDGEGGYYHGLLFYNSDIISGISDSIDVYGKLPNGAIGAYSHSEGLCTTAHGEGSHAEGVYSIVSNNANYAHAEGAYTTASGKGSHAEGKGTLSQMDYSHAEGVGTTANGEGSHAEGLNTYAEGDYSHAEGNDTSALTAYSHAEGRSSVSKGSYSHAEGYNTLAYGVGSHAEGRALTAAYNYINYSPSGRYLYRVSNNYNSKYRLNPDASMYAADFDFTIKNGSLIFVNNEYCHVKNLDSSGFFDLYQYYENMDSVYEQRYIIYAPVYDPNNANSTIPVNLVSENVAYGAYSSLSGYQNITIGDYSHAEGNNVLANKYSSHAEGHKTITDASYSHAEGFNTVTTGLYSHAEGFGTVADGLHSHAEGGDSSNATDFSYANIRFAPLDSSYIPSGCYGYIIHDSSNYNSLNIGNYLYDNARSYIRILDKGVTNVYPTTYYIITDKPIFLPYSKIFSRLYSAEAYRIPVLNGLAAGISSHAEGIKNTAYGVGSHAEGANTMAYGMGSHASGYGYDMHAAEARVRGDAGATVYTLLYNNNSAIYPGEVIYYKGRFAKIVNITDSSVIFDKTLDASYPVTGTDKLLIFNNCAYGNYSSTAGLNTIAYGDYSKAEGAITVASNRGSHAEGTYSIASGEYSHAEGWFTKAEGRSSHAEGSNTTASGISSRASGACSRASGEYADANNRKTSALGSYSHAEGSYSVASGQSSHAEGFGTNSLGEYSHAEGGFALASGLSSHAEGGGGIDSIGRVNFYKSGDINVGTYSVSYSSGATVTDITTRIYPGYTIVYQSAVYGSSGKLQAQIKYNTAKVLEVSKYSLTLDRVLTPDSSSFSASAIYYVPYDIENAGAYGAASHVEGIGTVALNDVEHAQGQFNISHDDTSVFGDANNTIHTIGIGISDSSRANAVEVMQNGDVYVRGIGNYDGSNYIDASTLQQVVGNSGGSAGSMTSIAYADLKSLRDTSALVPGMQYRITDYHTTVSPLITDASSADHRFDIIVTADSSTVLNENARAAHHDGDTYFASCKLEAWELQYRLDNDNWSRVAGTFIEDDGDGYHMRKLGTVEVDGETYILWDASEYTEDYEITRAVSEDDEVGTELKGYDPETGEILDEGWSSSIASKFDVEGDGQGTILMLKDEYGNQCPYDFKSIQFKRWAVTDLMQGRDGLDGKYMGVLNNLPAGLNIEDEDDFIWAYTFSSDATGSEDQVDYSLDGTHWVYGNVLAMAPDAMNDLNNVVFYGEYNYCNRFGFNCYVNTFGNSCFQNSFGNNCYNNSFGNECNNNTFGNGCYGNSFGNSCYNNSFGNSCFQNSFGNGCGRNSFGNYCYNNSFGNDCGNNTFGNYCQNNTFGNNCTFNSFGNDCRYNSFGNDCRYNSFGNNSYQNTFGNYFQTITVFDGVRNCSVTGGSQSAPIKNAQILNGTAGASVQNKLTIAFAANQNYTQIAGLNSSGVLKIWTPADLIN